MAETPRALLREAAHLACTVSDRWLAAPRCSETRRRGYGRWPPRTASGGRARLFADRDAEGVMARRRWCPLHVLRFREFCAVAPTESPSGELVAAV